MLPQRTEVQGRSIPRRGRLLGGLACRASRSCFDRQDRYSRAGQSNAVYGPSSQGRTTPVLGVCYVIFLAARRSVVMSGLVAVVQRLALCLSLPALNKGLRRIPRRSSLARAGSGRAGEKGRKGHGEDKEKMCNSSKGRAWSTTGRRKREGVGSLGASPPNKTDGAEGTGSL